MAPTNSPSHHRDSLWGILWHPYQGLWNWRLVEAARTACSGSVLGRAAVKLIILLDTVLLATRALARRVSRVGFAGLFSTPRVPSHISILYFDLGTHKEARELSFMVHKVLPRLGDNFTAYGFEACREFWEQARARFTGRPDVQLIRAALCHFAMPAGGTIKLYMGQGDGLEASIYRDALGAYEEVPALRLSDWVRDNHLDLKNSICLLRMNIEGAEFDIIQDLVENGLVEFVDGYYGMWDDISKIDARRSDEFRTLLRNHHIVPFTFNGRDLSLRARKKCIEYDIRTSIQAGLRRIDHA